jgi:hypothetical protein
MKKEAPVCWRASNGSNETGSCEAFDGSLLSSTYRSCPEIQLSSCATLTWDAFWFKPTRPAPSHHVPEAPGGLNINTSVIIVFCIELYSLCNIQYGVGNVGN